MKVRKWIFFFCVLKDALIYLFYVIVLFYKRIGVFFHWSQKPCIALQASRDEFMCSFASPSNRSSLIADKDPGKLIFLNFNFPIYFEWSYYQPRNPLPKAWNSQTPESWCAFPWMWCHPNCPLQINQLSMWGFDKPCLCCPDCILHSPSVTCWGVLVRRG